MSVYPSFDFAPYAQLLRTLMPRARGIYLYAPDADLIWSADGADLQDLRPVVLELLESARDSASIAGTREVLEDMPAYGFVLRDERSGVLGVLAIVCRSGGRDAELPAFEAVERLLAPLLTVARRDLAQQRVLDTGRFNVEDTQELQWLFDMSQAEAPAGAGDSLQLLMDAFAARAGCDVALLHVPTRRLERVAPRCILQPTELDTLRGLVSRHLLRVAQLQQKTLIVNKVRDTGSGALVPFRILCVPLIRRGQVLGVAVAFNRSDSRPFEAREARMLERLTPRLHEVIDTCFDSTTGLLTRHAFDERVASQLLRAPQDGRWLVHADIDDLRATNELYGFNAGDSVLRGIADIWRNQELPGESITARLGSDSFVALLDTPSLEAALAWTESVRMAVSALALAEPLAGVRVSLSYGLAPIGPGLTPEHSLASAESACSIAKESGRDHVEVYAASDARPAERQREQRLYRALLTAIEKGALALHAQSLTPLWDASRPDRYELLARLPGEEGQTIAAEQFIAIADRHQLTARLDEWVLGEALRRLEPVAAVLERRGVVFSLNLSGQSLRQPGLVERIQKGLQAHRVSAALLSFEISEPTIVANMAAARTVIDALRAIGCHCSIDDFGTGANSLATLNSLRVTALKIDGAFVRELATDHRAEAMVRGIVQVARQLGLDTVAECVGSHAMANQLGALGVTYGQGNALEAPQPFADALAAAVYKASPLLTEAVTRAALPPDTALH
ncbi:MAG: EAL domain-containing protein [Pseudomonadota bacterium]